VTQLDALVLRAEQQVDIESLRAEAPGAGEVAVRMAASGICGSDLHVFHGVSAAAEPPMVLGHEGAGVVVDVGAGVRDLRIGDHVVLASLDPCFRCPSCLRGAFYFCSAQGAQPVRLHSGDEPVPSYAGIGSLAERAVVPAARAVKVAEDVDLALLATVGCGVLTGLGTVLNSATPAPGESVLVIGCGGVGLNVIQGCRLVGAGTIVAVDTNADRLALAETFGATHRIQASTDDVSEALRAIVPGGVDLSFEVVGDADLVVLALELTRPGGTCVTIGAARPGAELRLPARSFMMTEKHLTGTLMGHSLPQRDIPKIVDLYRAGQILLDELVGERLPFADWRTAVSDTESGKVARCLVTFDTTT
jgi:S-(hydroxymethyl)glutathione dehydrogenase/alcohol dehydrogenase